MTDSSQFLASVRHFIDLKARPYLDDNDEATYPAGLVRDMAELGLFGMNIPAQYGGGGHDPTTICQANVELSKGWLSLASILGTHLRVAQYFLQCGTEQQRAEFLPAMAAGTHIAAHAYHERTIKKLTEFRTRLTRKDDTFVLNGRKNWVGHAADADFFIAVAMSEATSPPKPVAIIIRRGQPGLFIRPDLKRPGIKGMSLCTVDFENCPVNIECDLVGGLAADIEEFISTFKPASSLNFAARAVGAGLEALALCRENLRARKASGAAFSPVLYFRFAGAQTKMEAATSMLEKAVEGLKNAATTMALAHMVKVFCSDILQEVIRDCMMMMGGFGYAENGNRIERVFRDAASLPLIDTPNDILLSRIGETLLA